MKIKNEFRNPMAAAGFCASPALAKSMTEVFSRMPNPPTETGRSVTAPMMGIKTKK